MNEEEIKTLIKISQQGSKYCFNKFDKIPGLMACGDCCFNSKGGYSIKLNINKPSIHTLPCLLVQTTDDKVMVDNLGRVYLNGVLTLEYDSIRTAAKHKLRELLFKK